MAALTRGREAITGNRGRAQSRRKQDSECSPAVFLVAAELLWLPRDASLDVLARSCARAARRAGDRPKAISPPDSCGRVRDVSSLAAALVH